MRIIVDLQAAQNDSSFRGVGRYCKSLLKHMMPLAESRGHEIWLVLNDNFPDTIEPLIEEFSRIPRERIAVFPGMAPVTETVAANEWRLRAAEHLRELFISQLRPDVVHVSSLFEGSVDDAVMQVGRTGIKLPTVVTLYDLIPWVMSQHYITTPEYERFYFGKVDSLRRADLLLAISRHSADEAVRMLPCSPEKVVNISAAIGQFARREHSATEAAEIMKRYAIARPFVLYMPGGFDPRKNFATLFDAYARLPAHVRATHQLVIGSNIKPAERAALESEMARYGLPASEVCMTGYVPDDDLTSLYSLCRVHVFPSLYEGFGLPVLESLACGAPTIASNTSSLPEVIGFPDALFDPTSAQDIADRMQRALTDQHFRDRLRLHGIEQASRFSWSNSALAAMDAIERTFRAATGATSTIGSADELYDSVLSALTVHRPRVEPTASDMDLLRRSAQKAFERLHTLAI